MLQEDVNEKKLALSFKQILILLGVSIFFLVITITIFFFEKKPKDLLQDENELSATSSASKGVIFEIRNTDGVVVDPTRMKKSEEYVIYLEIPEKYGAEYAEVAIAERGDDYCGDWRDVWGQLISTVRYNPKKLGFVDSHDTETRVFSENIIFSTYETRHYYKMSKRDKFKGSEFEHYSGMNFLDTEKMRYIFSFKRDHVLAINLFDEDRNMIYSGNPRDCDDGIKRDKDLFKYIHFQYEENSIKEVDSLKIQPLVSGGVEGDGLNILVKARFDGRFTSKFIDFYYSYRENENMNWRDWVKFSSESYSGDLYEEEVYTFWKPPKVGLYKIAVNLYGIDEDGNSIGCTGISNQESEWDECTDGMYGGREDEEFYVIAEDDTQYDLHLFSICSDANTKSHQNMYGMIQPIDYFVKLEGFDYFEYLGSTSQYGAYQNLLSLGDKNYNKIDKVRVRYLDNFIEEAQEINLEVRGIGVGDKFYSSDSKNTYSTGTNFTKSKRCGEGFYPESIFLHCKGYFEYDLDMYSPLMGEDIPNECSIDMYTRTRPISSPIN